MMGRSPISFTEQFAGEHRAQHQRNRRAGFVPYTVKSTQLETNDRFSFIHRGRTVAAIVQTWADLI